MSIQRDKEVDDTVITRRFHIERLKEDDTTVYSVSLSSELEISDWPGWPSNVLMHSKDSVDLSGVSERGLPFLRDHGSYSVDNVIGRIHDLKVQAKRLVGRLVWSQANPHAERVQAMVDEGTITDMSISAVPIERKRIEDENGSVVRVEWTKWRPVEASAVAIGADQSVGIGRDSQKTTDGGTIPPEDDAGGIVQRLSETDSSTREGIMDDENETVVTGSDDAQAIIDRAAADQGTKDAAKTEDARIKMCRQFGESNKVGEDTIQMWIKRGASPEQIADDIVAILAKRGESNIAKSALDLTPDETQEYSLARAILAARDENWKGAGFEKECHEEICKRLNKVPDRHSVLVPQEIQRRQLSTDGIDINRIAARHGITRDLTAASAAGGGYTVGTNVVGFDPILRNISVLLSMGVTRLSGLRENVTIPRQTAAATADWLGSEADTIAESQQTFTQLPLTPHDVGGYTEISRRLLQQSSIGVEAMVSADLAAVVALAADVAGLTGTGADGQPQGLGGVSGIGAVTGTSLAFAGVLNFQEDVAAANVMPMSGGYVTTPAVASLMIQRVKYTNTASPLWEGNIWGGNMQGFPAMSSNQVAAATMYFGDWSKMILAEWGTLEIDTNPYAGFTAGIIGVRAIYSLDIGVRYPAAFSRAVSIT